MNRTVLYQRLFECISRDDVRGLQTCLSQGADRNYVNPEVEGRTPALHAAATGSLNCLASLIVKGTALTHHRDTQGRGILHLACLYGHTSIVEFLLAKRIVRDMETPGHKGLTPLMDAVLANQLEVVSLLLKNGANASAVRSKSGTSVLHLAARANRLEAAQMLLSNGADLYSTTAVTLWTPLHEAAANNAGEVVSLMIRHDHSVRSNGSVAGKRLVDFSDADGRQALHIAALHGHWVVCKVLVEEGEADLMSCDNSNRTALHYAAFFGDVVALEYLLENGADPLVKDVDGLMPLHMASLNTTAKPSHRECVVRLIEKMKAHGESDPTPGGRGSVSSASSSVSLRSRSLSGVGSANGQQPTAAADADSSGRTALHYAILHNSHPSLVLSLLDNGWRADTGDLAGTTPLHLACWLGNTNLLETMLTFPGIPSEQGASNKGLLTEPYVLDSHGRTPLHAAVLSNHSDCVSCLLAFFETRWSAKLLHGFRESKYGTSSANSIRDVRVHSPSQKTNRVNDTTRKFRILFMLSAKDKFGRNAVIMAQNGDMLRLLLSFVLPSEGVDLLTAEDTVRCWTALHFFAARGSIDCLEAALEYVRAGAIADPKVSIEGCLNRAGSSSGDTVLHAAVCGIAICPDLLRILIQNGASPFCVNKFGDTALHCCIKLGLPLCMKAILDSVSKDTAWKLCNQKNNNGITPLCLCVRSSLDADVADELCTLALFYGAQPSDASDDGSPPLADACAIIGYTNVVRVLLDHGANVDCFVRACPSSPKLSTVRRRSSDSDTQSDVSTGEYDQVTLTVLQIALAAHAVDTAVLLLARKASATRRDALEFAIHHLHHAEAINSSTSGAGAAVFERILNQHGQPGHSKYLHAALYSHAPAATISLLLRNAHDEVAMFAGVDFLGHNALHVAILANNVEGLKFVLQKARSNMLLEQMLSQKAQYANERMSGMVFPAFDEGVSLSVLHYAGLSTCPEIYGLIEDAILSCPALCTSASIGNMWRDDDGNTPLHYAAAVGNGSMCLRMIHTIARLKSDYPDVRMENDTDPVNSKGVSVGLLLLSHLQTYDLMHRFYVMGASLLHWCIVFGGSVDLIEDLCRLVRSRPMTVNASSQIENGSAPSSAYDPDATENDIVTNEDAHSSDEELPSLAADERSGSSVVIRAASTPLCMFDTSRPLLAVDHRGRTLLHQCVCAPCDDDRLAIVRFLLTRAPSMVNTPDGDGRSPVFYVADVRYLELICDRWSDALTVKDDDLVSFGVSLAMAENVNVELLSFVVHFLCKMASRSASSVAVSAVRELRQIACVAASFNRVDILRILYERLGCSVFDPLYDAGIVDELTKNGLQDGTLKSADNEKEKEYVLGLPPLSLAIVTDARDALSFLLSVCPISYLFSGHQTALQLAAAYDCYEPFAAVMSVVERCRKLANVDWRRLLVLLLKGDSVGPIALALSRGIVLTTVTDSVVTMLRNCCAPDRRLDQLDSARVREKEREKEFKSFRSVSSTWDRSLRRTSSVGSNSSLSSGLQKSVAPLPSIDATSERGVSGWTNSKRDGNERLVTLEMEFLSGLPDFVGITDEQWVRLMMASVDPSPLVDAYFDFRESWKGDNAVMRVLHFAVRQASVKVAECLLTNARTRGQGWERRLCGFGTAWNVLFETAFVANADARDGLFQFFLDLLDSTNMTVERDLLDPKSAVSPLHVACYVGNAHAVEFLLSLLLTSRVTGDHPDLVEKLRWLLNLRTVNGVTIIHLVTVPAVLNTIRRVMVDVGMTEAELKSVFVDEADSLGLTLCHYSAMYNNVEVGSWLNAVCGSAGVDPLWSERDFAGVSATEYAQHHLGSREFYEKCVLLQ